MIDTSILASCIADRNAYEKIKGIVDAKDFSPPVKFWFELVDGYYGRDKAASRTDTEILRELGRASIFNPKQREATEAVLNGLDLSVSIPNIVAVCLELRRRNLILELAANSGSGNDKKSNEIFDELANIWNRDEVIRSDIEYAKEWEELDAVVGQANRISLGISSLDSRIGGGAFLGNHILIFGRTEIGKSCLTISLTAHLSKTKRVLYVGNEDEINILKSRVATALLGRTTEQMAAIPNKAKRLLRELTQDRLTMVHMNPGSMSELEDLVEKHTPNVLVVDQIRNLGGSEDGLTRRMEANAIRLRSLLSKRRMLGISVTQGSDRSQGHDEDGPLYLTAGDVDSSRVGLPGQTDLQLGIGSNRDLMARGLRMISFAKNKLYSGPKSREPLLLRFDTQRSLVLDTQ
jgi:hypothetical protein